MAAILCRVCFVEPCKACAKCCEGLCKCTETCCDGFCKCMGSCCTAFSRCCDSITALCDKPFSGCLVTTIIINFIALLYGVISLVSGGNQCNEPLLILLICMFICCLINGIFSYYMYYKLNHNDDMTTAKLWEFFKYDKWMAVYIIFLFGMIALCVTSMVLASGCNSSISNGTLAVSIILLSYLGLSILIIFAYVAFDAFKEMANNGCWWIIPCCWPCMCIGCLLNCADNFNDSIQHDNDNKQSQYQAPVDQQTNNAPQAATQVVVVKQPITLNQAQPQQPVIVMQQPPQQIYQQPPQQVYQQVYQQPIHQIPANNNNNIGNVKPGVLVVHQTQPQQTYQQPINNNNNDDNVDKAIEYDDNVNAIKINTKKAAKDVGAAAKKAGISAVGWMAKKLVELNDKVQDDNKPADPAAQEGNGNGY